MKPYYEDLHNTLYCQDFRKNDLPDECVQVVVTSPPYWGLRKYSGEQELIWLPLIKGKDCEHEWGKREYKQHSGRGDVGNKMMGQREDVPDMILSDHSCSLCGAWKGAYGLEPTPEMYILHTIEILREIRRVLRKDGVVFWNIGDSYAGSGGDHKEWHKNDAGFQGNSFCGVMAKPVNRKPQSAITGMEPVTWEENGKPKKKGMTRVGGVKGLKPKDLCLIPFRVAIAAQEDGWWVRSVIIWSKPNPMPESVTDRPTESHEYILMLTKSARYYWNPEAVREEYSSTVRWGGDEYKGAVDRKEYNQGLDRERSVYPSGGRNIRSVWEFPTKPGPSGAVRNFAVFPEKLPELCIKAATPEVGCCSKCGAPWERVLEKTGHINKREPAHVPTNTPTKTDSTGWAPVAMPTNIWQPTCKCNADKVPSIVLDPFAGAGTTLWVAKKLNRQAVGYEISEEYCQLAVDRMRQQVLL